MGKMLNNDNFKHVNYHATDVKKTFARIRKLQAESAAKRLADEAASKAEIESIELEQQRKIRTIRGAK